MPTLHTAQRPRHLYDPLSIFRQGLCYLYGLYDI